MNDNATMPEAAALFADVTPGTFQQFTSLLLERLAVSQLPEMAGMIRLRGRWTDPGRASGKYFYGAKVVDDGGAQAKVEIMASLVASRRSSSWRRSARLSSLSRIRCFMGIPACGCRHEDASLRASDPWRD